MITYIANGGTRFHYNGDYSGEIIIAQEGKGEVKTELDDLLEFIGQRKLARLKKELDDIPYKDFAECRIDITISDK